MVKVQQFLDWINAFAPFDSAEGFDNVGLLMGDRQAEVHAVLFGMDVTEALVQKAVDLGAELIITHHPFIFRGLKRIDYTGPQGRIMAMLMQHGISVIAAHTNYDKAPGGVCDSLAAALGLTNVESCDDYVRVGMLANPLFPAALDKHIQQALHAHTRCCFEHEKSIRCVAVSGGSYGEGFEAALAAGADAYVVGEISYHQISDACACGLTVIQAGHFATELPGVIALYQRFLADAAASHWDIQAHLHDQAPFTGALLALE